MSSSPLLQKIAAAIAASKGLNDCEYKGCGAFKETYRVTDSDGEQRALKVVDRNKIDVQRTQREIQALRTCSSSFIAKIYDFFEFRDITGIEYDVVIEEFLDGGTLEPRVDNALLALDDFKILARGLVSAITELQRHKLVHRDIKPANIMYRAGLPDPVLVDFGLVRDLNQTSLTQSWLMQGPGTPKFAAPEQLLNERNLIDWRTDQFAIGVVLSYARLGVHPYQQPSMNISETVSAVAARKPSTFFATTAKSAGIGFLVRMTDPWPIMRYNSTDELLAEIQKL